MRIAKWLLIGSGALLAALVLAALVLTQLVDPGRYKGVIERQVAAATGREFRLTGDIDLAFFPWLALTTGAAELPAPAGFDDPRFLAWREAHVGVRLLPLLRGELVVDRIRLVGLEAWLVRQADGRVNWAFDAATDGATPQAARGEGSSVLDSLPDIAGIELRESRIAYVDVAAGSQLRLDDLRLDVEPVRAGTPMRISAAAVVSKTELAERLSFELDARATPGPPVLIENAKLEGRLLGGRRFAAEGVPWQFAAPRLRYDAASGALDVPEWRLGFDQARIAGALSATLGDSPAAEGRLELAPVSLRATLAAAGVQLPPTRDRAAYGRASMAAGLRLSDGMLQIEPLDIQLDDTHLTGRVTRDAGEGDEAVIRFALHADRMDLDRYLKPEDAPSEPFVFPAAALKALRAEGTLEIDEGVLGGARLRGIRLGAEP